MNRSTWAALQQAGFVPGTPLTVESFFFATNEANALALEGALKARGWHTRVSSASKGGLFKKRVEWMVVSTHSLDDVQLDVLDAMVDDLEALASTHHSDFDGWGAEVS